MATNPAAIGKPGLDFFKPFSNLTENQLILLASHSDLRLANKGENIINAEKSEQDAKDELFLLRGTLKLSDNEGNHFVVEGGSADSQLPLKRSHPGIVHATCMTSVKYVVIPTESIKTLLHDAPSDSYSVSSELRENVPAQRQLLFDIYQDLRNNKLALPSLPDVAIHIRKLIDSGTSDAKKIGQAVNADPAITAKLIKCANSPLFHGSQKITSNHQAVVRLGLKTTRHLITSFAVRELFNIDSKVLRKKMDETWQHSIDVAAISFVLAKKIAGYDADQALLGGLLHDIGAVPIIIYAKKYPEVANDPDTLQASIDELKSEIGGIILKRWGFDEELVDCAIHSEKWMRDSGDKPDLNDLVMIAQIHSFMGSSFRSDIPPLDTLPAFEKLTLGKLSPQMSLKILDEAKNQIDEARRLLVS